MRIKLMADYRCWPLWHDDDVDFGNIDPRSLPISDDLAEALNGWSELLDRTLNWDDPANTKWPEGFWTGFNGQGRMLAQRLRQELGPAYEVREHFGAA